MKKLSILSFTFLIGINCINAQTDKNLIDEFITVEVETTKSFGEHGQKEYVIVKTEKNCDGKRKTKNNVKFGNYNYIQKPYSKSKNNGFNFNKTNNYGSYKKSNNCLLQNRIGFFHNHHVIETDNNKNRILFEFISEEGDTMILNEEGGDHILISNDLSFTDKKNMEFITDDGKTFKIMLKIK
jgi:hypothetical protein